jgi:hypothetical protein
MVDDAELLGTSRNGSPRVAIQIRLPGDDILIIKGSP